ncbi:hypothetical protein EC988_003248 [Linderina pennispora]|nr:hypothetical protein EC988_003248 [Linderina pennispora]
MYQPVVMAKGKLPEQTGLGQPVLELREPPKHTVVVKYDMSRLLSIRKDTNMTGSFLVEPDSNPYNTAIVTVCIDLHITSAPQIDEIRSAVRATTTKDTYALELTQIDPPLIYTKVFVYMPHTTAVLPGLHIDAPNCHLVLHDLAKSQFGDIRILTSKGRCLISSVRCQFLWVECTQTYVLLFDAKAQKSIDVITERRPIMCTECNARFMVLKTTEGNVNANRINVRRSLQISTTLAPISLNNAIMRSAELTTTRGDIMAEYVCARMFQMSSTNAQLSGSLIIQRFMAVYAERSQVSLDLKEYNARKMPEVTLNIPYSTLNIHLPTRFISLPETFRENGAVKVKWIDGAEA